MPSRSRSRSRAPKRPRSRGVSRGRAGPVRSRAGYRSRTYRRVKPSLNTHMFSRYTAATNVDVNGTTLAGAFEYKFDDILGSTEFTSLFDQYKITKCVMKLQLVNNPDSTTALNANAVFNHSNWFPKFWYIRDYDGGGADSLAQIKERQGVKFFVLRPNKTYSIAVNPSVSVQTYRTATTTGYGPRKMFLDMGSGTDVPHYGLHYVVDTLGIDPNNDYPFKIRYEFQYFFTCKDVR